MRYILILQMNMIEEYKKCGELVYAVPGHPLVAERSVLNLN